MWGHVQVNHSVSRKDFESVGKKPLNIVAGVFPKKVRYELFTASVNKTDRQLHLNTSMMALQKVKEDDREWFWHEDF